jgi:hypothetical protein
MKRKIIQIVDRFLDKESEASLIALADDGTLWEGCTQCVNEEAIKKATELNHEKMREYKESNPNHTFTTWDKVPWYVPAPARVYAFHWQQIEGLPDDNSNLTKRFP